MVSLILEKISLKKNQLFPFIFPIHNKQNNPPFQKSLTPDIQRYISLGKMTRGFFHDLMNPLAALQLSLDHIQTHLKQHAALSIIQDIHTELCGFITTIQHNLKNPEERSELVFYEACIVASTLLKHKLTPKNIRLIILGNQELSFKTHALYLIQIITNGLSNAIDAFDDQPDQKRKTITLSFEMNAGRIHFTIHDNGSGIPDHIQKHIFDPYTSTKKHGHGIGLSATQDIVHNIFQGEISIASKENQGTTLTVDLPMGPQQPEYSDQLNQYQKN